ncbi:hypothetical protein GE061_019713 [Apolygus lucorum]|uniref:Uncharacterized protein n=1 Tax=Apolygus lucorum TaxID=248454 RepID=A0A6A4JY96_APOLU|nr:hypothetical protein GE061_019713 [Apolygus lucorum]
MEDKVNMLTTILVVAGLFVSIEGHGVATSSQSMISGEGWRYGYGIAHGPPGIGHAVGESFPHGYGGFGTYAPSYGYNLVPPPLPPRPIVVKLPPTYVLPAPVAPYPGHLTPLPVEPILPPIKPLVFPKPIPIVKAPYAYAPYQHYRPYYYLDDHEHYGHDHYHGDGHYHHEDPYYFHHKK